MSNELPESAVALADGNGLRHIRQLRLITLSSPVRRWRLLGASNRAGIIEWRLAALSIRLVQLKRPVPGSRSVVDSERIVERSANAGSTTEPAAKLDLRGRLRSGAAA